MAIVKPNYRGSTVVNLVHSIYKSLEIDCGTRNKYELEILKTKKREFKDKIILIIIDGAGESFYRTYQKELGLDDWYLGTIQSVYPSTTASSITSLLTGLTPAGHGIPGWHTFFNDISSIVNILPFKQRYSLKKKRLSKDIPNNYILFSKEAKELTKRMLFLQPNFLSETTYSKHLAGFAARRGYNSYQEFFQIIESFITENLSREFAYAYLPAIDSLSHKYGQNSIPVLSEARIIGSILRKIYLLAEKNETSVIITADHGFVPNSVSTTITTRQHPQLKKMLKLPLCGEPRTAFAYVHPKEKKNFMDYMQTYLKSEITVKSSKEMLKENWFGIGRANPEFEGRLGDFVLCMNDNYSIFDSLINETMPNLKGVHGGWLTEEVNVPLFLN